MTGGRLPGVIGPEPTGAPQKTIGTPLSGSFGLGPNGLVGNPKFVAGVMAAVGQGPSAGFDGTPAVGLAKLAKSARQLNPGVMMRMGVNPGQITKSQM